MQRKRRKDRREDRAAREQHEQVSISYWAVAFLDLLGYRNVLKGLDIFPLPESAEQVAAARQAFADAIRLRRRLLGGMRSFITRRPLPLDLSSIPPHLRPTAESVRHVKMFELPGPDHIVLACSLSPQPGHFPMRGVFTLVSAAATSMLLQLMIGADDPRDTLPLRGGIDVALGGLVNPEGFLYSPALTRAYDLEHECAVYPRTLAGDRFLNFLRSEAQRDGDFESRHSASIATTVRDMFFEDHDGRLALDFLGENVRANLEDKVAEQLGTGAWRYIRSALANAREAGDPRILKKYEWLEGYMRPRIQHWGVRV